MLSSWARSPPSGSTGISSVIIILLNLKIVARIAFDKLQSTSQGQVALAKANSLLKVYSSSHPSMTNLEGNYPFVECATFADEIKAKGGSWQSGWHFVDTPYFDKGGSEKDYPNFKPDPNSIDKAIPSLQEWISNSGSY